MDARVEQALFLHELPGTLPADIDRIYIGAEFCPWLLPSAATLLDAMERAHAADLAVTLATPILYETVLPDLQTTLEKVLPAFAPGDELLVSDFGAIEPARRIDPGVTLVFGRTLSGQKRGPQILELELSAEELDYFRQGAWYSAEARAFLAELGVQRVELDNLVQGVAPLPGGIRGSLHHPYAMVAGSRNCPYRTGCAPRGCAAGCGAVFRLAAPHSPLPLLQRGNTQFLENDRLPEGPETLGIDRLVRHPELPR